MIEPEELYQRYKMAAIWETNSVTFVWEEILKDGLWQKPEKEERVIQTCREMRMAFFCFKIQEIGERKLSVGMLKTN